MSKNEEKKAAPPPPRVRRGTKLNLDAGDRGMASPVVYRTDGRKTDFEPGERAPKVGHRPLMLLRAPRDKRIEPAPLAERNALHRALMHPDEGAPDAGARAALSMAVQASGSKTAAFEHRDIFG